MSSEKQCFICENKTKEYFTCNKTNRVLCESCVEITTSDEWGNDDKWKAINIINYCLCCCHGLATMEG